MALQNYKPGKAAFMFIFVTVALDMIALGVMIPVLPKLIVAFKGGDFGKASRAVGYFGIAWAFMQFMFQPVLGALADRFGRRPVILLSNIGLGLDYIVMALAPSLAWLFLGRLISGAAAASFSTANAYIADITPVEKRAARFGMLGAPSASVSCWDRRSAAGSARSTCACHSGARRGSACSTRPMAISSCRNRWPLKIGRTSSSGGRRMSWAP